MISTEEHIGGLKAISAAFEFRGIWNLATGSVSSRLPEFSTPHGGIVGIRPPVDVFELAEFASFRLAGGADDSSITS